MIDDPELPRPPRVRRGGPEPSAQRRAQAHPEEAEAGVPPAAPPPIDEWELGDSDAGWAAVTPQPFDAGPEASPVTGGVASAGPRRPRDACPAIVRLFRPWFDPRPGELRGAIVLLSVALAVSIALWFDASRRPDPVAVTSPAATVPSVLPPSGAGRADGSDGWGMEERAPRGPVVHVSGAVERPGVVTLPEGSRVADAIEAAGGAMPDARLDRLNLARIVEDAERVHVPRVGEDAPPPDEPASRGVLPDGRIDLNAASQAELETLPGVGPARAQAIIAEREARAFRVAGDLRRVPGIGEATFQRLAPLVAVR